MIFQRILYVVPLVMLSSIGGFAQDPQTPLPAPAVSILSEQDLPADPPAIIDATPVDGAVPASRAAANRLQRQEIRSMDILERPYRNIFHVYGNTVRRRHERGALPLRAHRQ